MNKAPELPVSPSSWKPMLMRPDSAAAGRASALAYAATALLLLLLPSPHSAAQAAAAQLASYIAGIQAIAHHAHPMRPVLPGAAPDSEYDALPLDGIPSFTVPWRLRPENAQWGSTARAFFSLAPNASD